MRELKSLHPTRADGSPITCLVVYIPERLGRRVLATVNANTKEARGAALKTRGQGRVFASIRYEIGTAFTRESASELAYEFRA